MPKAFVLLSAGCITTASTFSSISMVDKSQGRLLCAEADYSSPTEVSFTVDELSCHLSTDSPSPVSTAPVLAYAAALHLGLVASLFMA